MTGTHQHADQRILHRMIEDDGILLPGGRRMSERMAGDGVLSRRLLLPLLIVTVSILAGFATSGATAQQSGHDWTQFGWDLASSSASTDPTGISAANVASLSRRQVNLNGTVDASAITASDAARALEPVVGRFAETVFALGIIGTGLLAIPVLAGSTAYAVADTFRWKATLECEFSDAPRFYGVIIAATTLGTLLTLIGLQPIRALYWSAILNGIAAAPIMFALMRVSRDSKIVGKFQLPGYLRVVGWIATSVMLVASIIFLVSTFAFDR